MTPTQRPRFVPPMLGTKEAQRELPSGEFIYEPKWDGHRLQAHRLDGVVTLYSREGNVRTNDFPEIVAALEKVKGGDFILDGEVVPATRYFDFGLVGSRSHAEQRRVKHLTRTAPVAFVVFDALMVDGENLRRRKLTERKVILARLLRGSIGTLIPTPHTTDIRVATKWLRYLGHGIDGVMAKPPDLAYLPDRRVMIKVKPKLTVDCVIAGVRPVHGRTESRVGALHLGLYDSRRRLVYVGTIPISPQYGREMLPILTELATSVQGHPWKNGVEVPEGPGLRTEQLGEWIPLVPETVCRVAAERIKCGRLIQGPSLVQWHENADPLKCRLRQIQPPAPDMSIGLALGTG